MSKFYEHPTFKASSFAEATEYAKDTDMVVTKKISIKKYITPNTECRTPNTEYFVLDNI